MSRVLVLAGGSPHAHDLDACGDALCEVLGSDGHEVLRERDPDAAAQRLAAEGIDALVVDGLWWRMHGEIYDAWRTAHAYTTPATTRRSITDFVSDGGGLLALHTAVICFDDWAEWGDIVGGAWQWGISSHPPRGDIVATVVADHPVVEHVDGELHLVDEVYGDPHVHPGVEVLATARRDSSDDDQPVIWAHRFGEGRVVFDGFGHDADSIHHAGNSAVIRSAVSWIVEGS